MFEDIDPVYIFYAAAVGAILAAAETIYLLTFTATAYRRNVNRRLAEYDGVANREEAVLKLRRERGIGGLEQRLELASWLNRLILQSGVTIGYVKLGVIAAILAVIADRKSTRLNSSH